MPIEPLDARDHAGRSRLSAMLSDPQFWTPVVMLLLGLLILAWVHG